MKISMLSIGELLNSFCWRGALAVLSFLGGEEQHDAGENLSLLIRRYHFYFSLTVKYSFNMHENFISFTEEGGI